MKKIILIAIIILILGVGGYFFWKGNLSVPFLTSNSGQPPSVETMVEGNNEKPENNTSSVSVEIRDFTFDPSSLTIKIGTTVIWKNEDSTPHKIASDPHPEHTDLPELVSGVLSEGQEYSFTFNKAGTFGYHCHLHPSMQGKIIVEQ